MIALPGLAMLRDRGAPVGRGNPPAGVAVPAGERRMGAIHLVVTGVMLIAAASGLDLGGRAATVLCCGAILLLGLPHGALDMVALLKAPSRIRATAAYLALAGAMAALWWVIPGAALLLFFAVAIGHFGEDWPGPGLVANGAALALLAAPSLFHHDEVTALFLVIAGPDAIPPLADSLLMVAPVAIAAGLTSCALIWNARRHMLAASSAAALAGMLLLPPLLGFALSFGLSHSPRQFARGIMGLRGKQAWRGPVVLATGMSLFLVAGVAWFGSSLPMSASIVRATFVALSVLTIPHMLLPLILRNVCPKPSLKSSTD